MPARSASPDSAGQAEIGNPDPAAAIEHDVGRLQIAMHDAAVVCRREAGADLAGELDRAVLGKRPMRRSSEREILAVDVLHRQEGVPFELVDVVDAADVRMRNLPRHAALRRAAA